MKEKIAFTVDESLFIISNLLFQEWLNKLRVNYCPFLIFLQIISSICYDVNLVKLIKAYFFIILSSFFLLDTERRLALKLAGFVPSYFIYTTASKSKMAYPKGLYATAPGLCVVNSWSENVYGRWIKVFERIIWNEVLICFLNLLHHANNMIVK